MRMMRARDRGGLENHVNISDLQIKVRPFFDCFGPQTFSLAGFLPSCRYTAASRHTLLFLFSKAEKQFFTLDPLSLVLQHVYNVECVYVWIYVPQWWSVQVAMRNVILIIYHHIKNSKPHQEKQNVKTFLAVIFSCVSKQVSFYTV